MAVNTTINIADTTLKYCDARVGVGKRYRLADQGADDCQSPIIDQVGETWTRTGEGRMESRVNMSDSQWAIGGPGMQSPLRTSPVCIARHQRALRFGPKVAVRTAHGARPVRGPSFFPMGAFPAALRLEQTPWPPFVLLFQLLGNATSRIVTGQKPRPAVHFPDGPKDQEYGLPPARPPALSPTFVHFHLLHAPPLR
ncbi:hypothetical protein CH63R_10181 [Colletotrichum higginsianum IMI 349063]|uniref:Uncharacterized protein n=1 Tax=Colletotrichum higginsianum (strain IMI 349063) TaxID=759273 RepID=A0A1B7Y214_COLHI|nr:uncharacterized protein CH63R_10181 [Colletotrichum higginsianum IMI 349063]OBR06061.1 hypothetical protein CH63R_10181 [Colletotrichum higginsianum IMI 349063]